MGAKISVGKLFTHSINSKKFIDLGDWRAIREDYYSAEKNTGLFIVIPSFQMLFLPEFTINQLNIANHENMKLDIKYKYMYNTLSCRKCGGHGKLDWVEEATGKKESYNVHDNGYIRDKTRAVSIVAENLNDPPYYWSATVIELGYKLCKHCYGSGLYMQNPIIVGRTILENS